MTGEYDYKLQPRDDIELVDGVTYLNGLNEPKTIVGTPYGYPTLCYSSDGNWFERATGANVGYDMKTGEQFAKLPPSWRDLWKRRE